MYIQYDINIISMLILTVVLINNIKNGGDSLLRQRFFRGMIISDMVILVIYTAVLILTGKPGSFINVLLMILYSVFFLACSAFCLLWALFCTMRRGPSIQRYELILLFLPLALLFSFLLLNFATGFIFSVSDLNVYARERFFHISSVCIYSYVVYSAVLLWRNKKDLSAKETLPYFIMPLMTMASGIVQLIIDVDVLIVWPCAALVLLIIQMSMMGEKMNMDHLTGLYNRKYLDDYIDDMLQLNRVGYGSKKSKKFAALMLDIDGFKKINDSFGHLEGDRAIMAASALLMKSVRKGDFISRYGGDEFLIILDQCSSNTPNRVIKRIRDNLARFNNDESVSYKLEFSIGYKIFSDIDGLSAKDIFSSIDELMYKNKQSKKAAKMGSGSNSEYEYNRAH